jgi:hypothetical protein
MGKTDAQKAYDIVAGILRRKVAGKLTRTIDAAQKRGRRPPATLKLRIGEFVGAEFRARLRDNRAGGWMFDEVEIAVVADGGKRPAFGAVLNSNGVRWTNFGYATGERLARIVADILAVTARGEAHFVALGEADQCQVCGRPLVDERSVEVGIGPECIRFMFGAADAAGQEPNLEHVVSVI